MEKNALDEMINDVENSTDGFDKDNWLDLNNEGKYLMRGLPLKDGTNKYPSYKVLVHGNWVDPNRGTNSVFKCIGTSAGCALCLKSAAEKKGGNQNAWKRQARVFYLYRVIDNSGKLRLLKAPQKLHDEIRAKWLTKAKNERIDIFSLNEGHVIEITRKGLGESTKWSVKVALEIHPVTEKDIALLKRSKPLDKAHMNFTKEQLEMVAKGVAWKEKTNNTRPQSKPQPKQEEIKPTPAPVRGSVALAPKVDLFPPDQEEPVREPVAVAPKVDLFPPDQEEAEPVKEASDDEVAAMKAKIFGKKKAK